MGWSNFLLLVGGIVEVGVGAFGACFVWAGVPDCALWRAGIFCLHARHISGFHIGRLVKVIRFDFSKSLGGMRAVLGSVVNHTRRIADC